MTEPYEALDLRCRYLTAAAKRERAERYWRSSYADPSREWPRYRRSGYRRHKHATQRWFRGFGRGYLAGHWKMKWEVKWEISALGGGS